MKLAYKVFGWEKCSMSLEGLRKVIILGISFASGRLILGLIN